MSDSLMKIVIKAQDLASGVMGKLGRTIDKVKGKASSLAKDGFGKIQSAGKSMATGLMIGIPVLGGLIGGLGVSALTASANFETMRVALNTAFQGNQEAAKAAFDQINDFTAKTPFQLEEVMTGFIKLKNMGLDPSERALRSYGDTASSMGKGLNDMVEAVADAATGEFERLKEFGIRASQQGDQVTFTFKGVETTVAKNSAAIEEYLIGLGETNFAGGMEAQSQTLMGKLSTLRDNFQLTMAAFADDSGLTDWAKKGIDAASRLMSGIKPLYDLVVKGDYTKGLNTAFGWAEDSEIVSNIFDIRDGIKVVWDFLSVGNFSSTTAFIKLANSLGLSWDQASQLASWLSSAKDQIITFTQDGQKMEALLVGLAAVIGTVVVAALWSMAAAVVAATWPFVFLGLTVAGLYYAYKTNLWGIKDIVDQVFGYIVNEIWPKVEEAFNYFTENVWPKFTKAWEDFVNNVWPMLEEAFNNFTENVWPKFVEAWQGFVDNVWPLIQGALMSIWDNIANNLWPAVMNLWDVIQNKWLPALIALWEFILPVLLPVLGFLAAVIGGTIYIAIQVLIGAITLLITWWAWLYDKVAWVIQALIGAFQKWVSDTSDKINKIKGFFQGLWDKAVSIKDGIARTFSGIGNSIASGIRSGVNGAIDSLNNLIRGANQAASAVGIPTVPEIPRFAKGVRNFSGGLAVVGERGPELVNLPRGSDVYSNQESRQMAGGQSVTINIDARGALLDDKTVADFARRTKKIFNQQGFATN